MMDEDILDDFNDHFNSNFNGDGDYKKISDHFNDVDAYCSRVDVGRRYRGINLIYEAVINQGVPLHCLGEPTNTDAVPFTLLSKVTQKAEGC